MTYTPEFSLAMIEARELSNTMIGAAVHQGAEREADITKACKLFVSLGEMLLKLREPKPSAEIIPILSKTRRVPMLTADEPFRAMSPEGVA